MHRFLVSITRSPFICEVLGFVWQESLCSAEQWQSLTHSETFCQSTVCWGIRVEVRQWPSLGSIVPKNLDSFAICESLLSHFLVEKIRTHTQTLLGALQRQTKHKPAFDASQCLSRYTSQQFQDTMCTR